MEIPTPCVAARTNLWKLVLSLFMAGGFAAVLGTPPAASIRGTLRDVAGNALFHAVVELRVIETGRALNSPVDPKGAFVFTDLAPGSYAVSVRRQERRETVKNPVLVREGEDVTIALEVSSDGQLVLHRIGVSAARPSGASPNPALATEAQGTGGERLSSKEVSALPLNKRDFSQLLLLAGGTQSDTNGSSNFTQQFAVNGQRGTTAVFAMDGIFSSDPEMGGATFSNFNVEAIQEIRSNSGVMPAEVGQGAASFTDIITKSGISQVHGAAFSFVRNAAFDARNFFDRRSTAQAGRIPPFVRNEFGLTNGGPVVLPGLYDGRDRTFYFGQYQGFRQVLGTTQVFPVPTLAERQGVDTTAFPGDTLLVPVNPEIAPVLAGYPLPNDPQGAFGARTYATSSKVSTNSDQFSLRIDHRISDKAAYFARFSFNNLTGPLTNPSQTAIDPSFAIRFFNHQRSLGMTYTRTNSPRMTSESSFGYIRTTPNYPTLNLTQPGLIFADGLYESFNAASGSVIGAFTNLFQARQNFAAILDQHTFKWGAEARFNRDTGIQGINGNGGYTFGGGPAYAQTEIPSLSGQHDIHVGDQLPDTLTGLLTATPYSHIISVAPPMFPQGDHLSESAGRREAYNFYFQDTWKVTSRLTVNYGLRYEVATRFHEAHKQTSAVNFSRPDGSPAHPWDADAQLRFLVNPQPPYAFDWRGWGPRLALDWRVADKTVLHAGGAITTILPSPWLNNWLMGGTPYMLGPVTIANRDVPVEFHNSVVRPDLPELFTPAGEPLFQPGQPSDQVAPNTEFDVERFERDLAAATQSGQINPYPLGSNAQDFQNGYIETFIAGLEHDFGEIKFSASYVGTAGVKLASLVYVNGYYGAEPAFAPFTKFNAAGQVVGGVGTTSVITSPSHSTFHSLQTGVAKTSARGGLGFTASYTFSKSLDDASTPLPGIFNSYSSGTIQTPPQDPRNLATEKGPSIFDVTHAFTLSFVQELPFERLSVFRPLGRLASGWQLLNITTLASGSPFTVYSGVQQTGMGAGSADRPDQVDAPLLATNRTIREDYFGRGNANASFFNIPINVPGGTGPNQGRFGTLGRNTFRGPAYHNFDFALTKDTKFGHRAGVEAITLQFRAEFFNVFNLVNFGIPSSIIRGSGFGIINRTAGPSRQIQFSLKLLY